MDGSHRLAVALCLGADSLPVMIRPCSKAAGYGLAWFAGSGFAPVQLQRIAERHRELEAQCLEGISCILWPPAQPFFDDITAMLRLLCEVRQVQERECRGDTLARLVRAVYACDDIEEWKVARKLLAMAGRPPRLRSMRLYLPVPAFRLKAQAHTTISSCGEQLKALIRTAYKARIPDYFHDIIVHTGDNYTQSRYLAALLEPGFSLRDYFAAIAGFGYMIIRHDAPYASPRFPAVFPFGKDLDVICAPGEVRELADATVAYLRRSCRAPLQVRTVAAETGWHIRVEAPARAGPQLVYQFDLSDVPAGLTAEFVAAALARRTPCGGFFAPRLEDELIFRAQALAAAPAKQHHAAFIRAHSADWQPHAAREALAAPLWQRLPPDLRQ